MNKSIKKIITFFAVIVLSLTVVGCSKKEAMTPEQSLNEYFENVKKAENLKSSKDVNTILAKAFENDDPNMDFVKEMGKENTDKFINDFMIPIANSIEYKIGEVTINDNSATAKVNITAIDISEKIGDIFGGVIREAMKLGLDGKEPTDEEIAGILINELINASKGENAQKSTSDIEMTLEKKNNEWVVNENTQLEDILAGNLNKIVEKLKSFDMGTPSN
ncbi:hypothetical protein [Clostridium sp. UBA6640]|uniref:hypothetical protein n=1 Tax=Clostridium sp. UBA6640 TaxID=1946370 RepID=UPI0025BC0F35|nr:hypothetical protein [Clostridium sp. UBA6640]